MGRIGGTEATRSERQGGKGWRGQEEGRRERKRTEGKRKGGKGTGGGGWKGNTIKRGEEELERVRGEGWRRRVREEELTGGRAGEEREVGMGRGKRGGGERGRGGGGGGGRGAGRRR